MDSKDLKGLGKEESEGPVFSHVVHTSGAVFDSPGQNQKVKPESCNLSSSSSSGRSSSELDEDIPSELLDERIPSVVAPLYSGKAPEHLWTGLLPQRDPSPAAAETVNEEESFRLVRLIHPSKLKLVKEITEGGQATIFLAKYLGTPVIVKRYKCGGVDALDLQKQKEVALKLQREMEMVMRSCEGTSNSRLCPVIGVSVDKTGKVLVVMQLMGGDLRTLIDKRFDELRVRQNQIKIMREIASGIRELHACGRIHKDIKASNILVSTYYRAKPRAKPRGIILKEILMASRVSRGVDKRWESMSNVLYEFDVKIGDYESSDDVVGTEFWRPPEVLRALRDGILQSDLRLVYSPAADVYGFGMVCYEILTGRIPFEGHRKSDYDLVLSGGRPDIPLNVSPVVRDLLHRCWHEDPRERPGWREILHILDSAD
jgi:serine/threonine protein kinase